MPKISIIIPIYNAENYLKRCLNSVINQTLKDIEIICINDCSKDNSLEILKEYSKKDNRIKIINLKENKGESKARNIGLDNTNSEYIAFLDNDDEIDLDFYEKLYNKAIKTISDIVKAGVDIINYDKKHQKDNLNELIKQNNSKLYFTHYWWSAIYKSSLIKENNIKFLEKYEIGEDILFLNQAILNCKKLEIIDNTYYHYHKRENSTDSKILNYEKIKSIINIREIIINNILNYEDFDKLSDKITNDIFIWHIKSILNCCYRTKNSKELDYIIDKTILIYTKINKYIKINSNIDEIHLNYLKSNNKEKLKELYLKNNTPKKMFIESLRLNHKIKSNLNA